MCVRQWVSCKERLPEPNGCKWDYWIVVRDEDGKSKTRVAVYHNKETGLWGGMNELWHAEQVTHWMDYWEPLPPGSGIAE